MCVNREFESVDSAQLNVYYPKIDTHRPTNNAGYIIDAMIAYVGEHGTLEGYTSRDSRRVVRTTPELTEYEVTESSNGGISQSRRRLYTFEDSVTINQQCLD
jgi:hypothetical protein